MREWLRIDDLNEVSERIGILVPSNDQLKRRWLIPKLTSRRLILFVFIVHFAHKHQRHLPLDGVGIIGVDGVGRIEAKAKR
jgi:hypothetical protein